MQLVQLLEPSKHGRLVEFVCGLQKQVARDQSTGEPISLQQPSDVLWTRMLFGLIERETWECGDGYIDPESPDLKGKQRRRWVNLSAFLAQFTQAADISYAPPQNQGNNVNPLYRSHCGLRTFIFALENDDVSMPILANTAVMEATCIWLIYAGSRLWDNVRFGWIYMGIGIWGLGVRAFKERGWWGFERNRWDTWGERLMAARKVCVDERMRGLIDEALGCMERVMAVQ